MLHKISSLAAILILLNGCSAPEASLKEASNYCAIQVEPPRNGEMLVIVIGGPVKNKGERWFPAGSTLASVLDWAGIDASFPPRTVRVVEADGKGVRYRVAGRPRKELEQVKLTHGTRVMVPWDRCFGFAPNFAAAVDPPIPPVFHFLASSVASGT
jgi:hypothetical protein